MDPASFDEYLAAGVPEHTFAEVGDIDEPDARYPLLTQKEKLVELQKERAETEALDHELNARYPLTTLEDDLAELKAEGEALDRRLDELKGHERERRTGA